MWPTFHVRIRPSLSSVVKTLKSPVSGLSQGICLTKELILENLVPTVVSVCANRGREAFLTDAFLDLGIVYRLLIRTEETGEGLAALTEDILIREGVLGENGMSRAELLSHAVANMKRLYRPEIQASLPRYATLCQGRSPTCRVSPP